ncbi:hypothetical protein AB0G15_34090 [Streptosporangium sp. NPDC023825]|uniref:hypothetical protein n=1 Tax=Streptosporangium sp. NPDC023825 TaxID=3154909 RepID=UPI00343E5802
MGKSRSMAGDRWTEVEVPGRSRRVVTVTGSGTGPRPEAAQVLAVQARPRAASERLTGIVYGL